MQSLKSILLAIAALVSCAASQAPITAPVLGADPFVGLNLPQDTFGASVLAYIYSSPLIGWARIAGGGKVSRSGTNVIRGGQGLPGSSLGVSVDLAQANVDTVYAQALVDLSAEDLVLSIPPMQKNRYISFSFFDPFSDDYAVIGTVHNDPSGRYLIRPTLKTGRGGKSTQNCKGYVGCIDSPVLNFFILIRVLALPNNQSDLAYVQKFIANSKLTSINKHAPTAKALTNQDFENLSSNRVTQSFQLMARFADRLLPQNTILATFVPFILEAAGISNGTYTPVPSVDLTDVENALGKIDAAFSASPVNILSLNNGWTSAAPFWSGSFQGATNLVARAHEGRGGYAQNVPDESIYPLPPQSTYTLQENEALVLTFSRKPPIKSMGFWSLTLYKPGSPQLYPNPQGVHALGDRSDLTYPDGARIYRGGNPKRDGPFQLLIQPSDQQPPKNWTGNFLPAPKGQPFRLLLRLYAPILQQTATQNTPYIYPKFKNQNAIT